MKKSRIRETPTLSTDGDSRTDTNFEKLRDLFIYFLNGAVHASTQLDLKSFLVQQKIAREEDIPQTLPHTYTDMATYRMNWSRGRFIEKKTRLYTSTI